MSVEVYGIDDVELRLDEIMENARDNIDKYVRAGAVEVLSSSVESMQRGVKTGKVYKRGDDKEHQSSAPGEAPATDTGNLASSVMMVESKDDGYWLVGTDEDYGEYLEFGTEDMKARPWLIPALEENRDKIERKIQQALRDATK